MQRSFPNHLVLLLCFMASQSLLLVSPALTAQSAAPRFERMPADRGFFQSIAYALAQDQSGHLWVATEEGALRYNSHEAVVYGAGSGLPTGFDGSVRAILVTPENDIWIAGKNRLARYDRVTDTFVALERKDGRGGPNLIRYLTVSGSGKLLTGAFNGVWEHDPETGLVSQALDVRNAEVIFQTRDGRLLVGSAAGLYARETPSAGWSVLPLSTGLAVTALAESDGSLLVGTKSCGLYRFTPAGKWLPVANVPPRHIRDVLVRDNGNVLVATDGEGIFELADDFTLVAHHHNDVNAPRSISSDGVYDLLVDREGILWMATYGGGVNKLDPYTNAFTHLTHGVNTQASIIHPFTRAILEDGNGKVWFGTKDGISVWNPTDDTWEHLLGEELAGEKQIVTAITETGAKIYAATFQGSVYAIDRLSLAVKRLDLSSANLESQARIFALGSSKNNELWIGGVNMPVLSRSAAGDLSQHSFTQCKVLVPDAAGNIWAAGQNGISLVSIRDGKTSVRSLTAIEEFRASHPFTTTNDVLPEGDAQAYLATNGAGLLTYRAGAGEITAITTRHGLPSANVQSILRENESSLWVSTSRGIANISFVADDTIIRVFTESDGLLGSEFNYGSATRLRDGRMLFGGNKGVTVFDPKEVGRQDIQPTIILEDLLLFNERQPPGGEVLPAHLSTLDRLELRYDQNALTLRFAGISNAAAGDMRYRWRMTGLSDQWSDPTTINQVNLTNVKPGAYQFNIQAATQAGDWGEIRSLEILVSPPWWRTWWAYLGYLLLFASAAYFVFRYVRSRVRNRNVEKQIDFFNNITHELKTPLAILLASLDEITESSDAAGREANKKIRKTTKRLTTLFDQLLNFHKASSAGKSRHIASFDPGPRLRDLTLRFSPLLKERDLSLTVDEASAPDVFHYDRDIFDKIVFNLVSNAVKYSRPGGNIEVSLGRDGSKDLELIVRDDGIGIPADQQRYILTEYYRARNAVNSQLPGTGLGLMMVKSMVEKEGGGIRFTSKENEGTAFFVRMNDRGEDLALTQVPSKVATPPVGDESADKNNHILIVEDNDELRASLANRLSRHFKVTTATNGREGLAKASEHFPDLIVTDLIMPEMDGMELSQAVQADFQLNHIPIFMLTVLHNSAQKVESIETGITEYLEKPVNFELLLAKINNTLNWRKRMRERYTAQDEVEQAAVHRDEREAEFIGQLETYAMGNIANESLSVSDLCQEMGMSRTSLYMKMKNLIDLSPQDFIIHTRLKEARRLLAETDETVKGIAYECGFSNPKYFSTSFKKKYALSPMAFRKSLQKGV